MPRPRWMPLLPLVAAGVLLPALPGLLDGGASLPGDGNEIPLPGLVEAGRQLAAGTLPVWTPSLYGGAPLPSAGDVGTRLPANLLAFALLPGGLAYGLLLAIHLALGAAGSAAFARRLGSSPAGAAVAALAFGGGGFVVGHTENLVRIEAIALTPWIFWAAERLVQRPGPRAAAWLGLALGGALLTGYLPFSGYALGWALLYGLGRLWQRGTTGRRRAALGGALGGGLLAGLVSLAQTLPLATMLPLATQSTAPPAGFAVDNSLDPRQLSDLLAPFAWQGPGFDVQAVFFFGLLPLALVFVALSPRRGGHAADPARILGVLGGASLLLSMGENIPGYAILAQAPPLAQLGRPYRLFIGGAALLPAAAALGWDRLGARRRPAWGLLALPAAALVLRLAAPDPGLLLAWALGTGALGLALVGRRRLALGLLCAELVTVQARHLGHTGPSPLASTDLRPPAAARWLGTALGPDERFVGYRAPDFDSPDQLWMQSPMRFGLASLQDGATTLVPWWFADALGGPTPPSAAALRLGRARFVLTAQDRLFADHPEPARFGAVAVRTLGPPAPVAVLAPDWATAPRAEIVATLRSAPALAPLLARPLLEQGPPPPAPHSGDCGTVAAVESGPGWRTLAVDSPRPCLLLVTDSWHPDWQARWTPADTAAATPLPVHRAWATFLAVPLPAGRGTVALAVRPWDQWLGLAGSALGLLLCAGLLAMTRRGGSPPRSG